MMTNWGILGVDKLKYHYSQTFDEIKLKHHTGITFHCISKTNVLFGGYINPYIRISNI